jgi:hypothetical protein
MGIWGEIMNITKDRSMYSTIVPFLDKRKTISVYCHKFWHHGAKTGTEKLNNVLTDLEKNE